MLLQSMKLKCIEKISERMFVERMYNVGKKPLAGMIDLNFRIVSRKDELLADPTILKYT